MSAVGIMFDHGSISSIGLTMESLLCFYAKDLFLHPSPYDWASLIDTQP